MSEKGHLWGESTAQKTVDLQPIATDLLRFRSVDDQSSVGVVLRRSSGRRGSGGLQHPRRHQLERDLLLSPVASKIPTLLQQNCCVSVHTRLVVVGRAFVHRQSRRLSVVLAAVVAGVGFGLCVHHVVFVQTGIFCESFPAPGDGADVRLFACKEKRGRHANANTSDSVRVALLILNGPFRTRGEPVS